MRENTDATFINYKYNKCKLITHRFELITVSLQENTYSIGARRKRATFAAQFFIDQNNNLLTIK